MSSKVFLLASSLLLLGSCQGPGRSVNSILVIAVDHLRSSDLDCSREGKIESRKDARPLSNGAATGGLEVLCQSAYRFSHVYTSSTLSAPALGTILTGQYPLAHGLHDNAEFLSPQIETAAERAFQKGYDTAFFSGGAPVLRKTGLNQGFTLFEDSIKLHAAQLIRPFKSSTAILKSRIKELGNTPFFDIVYVPDLQFINNPTTNSLGEPRNFSYESQFEEFDDGLGELFRFLKSEHRWDNTQVVLVGLNGRPSELRKNVILPANLHSENTQVALFWKPAGPAIHDIQTFNTPLSLADVGSSLYEWLGVRVPDSEVSELPTMTLKTAISSALTSNKTESTQSSRWIASESGWAKWRWQQTLQVALRKDQVLCLNKLQNSPNSQCFNTITDKDEVFELPPSDRLLKERLPEQIAFLKKYEITPIDSFRLRRPELTTLKVKNIPCYQIFERGLFDGVDSKKCEDPLIQDLIQWLSAEQNPQIETPRKELIRKRFFRSLAFELVDRNVAQTQNQIDWIWDVPANLMSTESLLDHIFKLPELAKIRAQAYRALNQSHDE